MKSIFIVITLLLLAFGFYQAIFAAPTEQTMGDIQRIFYYHLPSWWAAFILYFVNFIASIVYLRRRTPGSDALALATAEMGIVFSAVGLTTGPLWAKPVWGIWWTWDARLTTALILFLIYVSYLMLRRFSEGDQTPTIAAAFAIFGFLDVPIVYMSIRWWRTQHPQPVIGGGPNSGLDPAMRLPLYSNLLAFLAFAALVVWFRYSVAMAERRIEQEEANRALNENANTLRPETQEVR